MIYAIVKRVFDILFSGIALLMLSPLFIPISIVLLFTGEGYVFYLQERVGFKNRLFKIYKFATMLKDSPNMPGGIITVKNDPRLTPLGSFLRKTKINELPQLINILIGDMSFVGPRPLMKTSYNVYPESVRNDIYSVKPGLTGIGSIIFRDEESLLSKINENGDDVWSFYSLKVYPYKGVVEKWYRENKGFITDLLCLFITFWVVPFPESNIIYRIFPSLPVRPF
ncbi:MAG TPA: sugar transferase [Saprospiraceae bacterium]|nr:sugar transferase [Saprospiraceae bacterium]